MGMGIVTLVATGIAGCEHKAKINAQKEVTRLELTIGTMIKTAEYQAKEAESRENAWKLANQHIKDRANRERADLMAELQRMRDNPIRPDGSAIPTSTCPGSKSDGVPEKLVSLTEYESLQARAAADAQDWVRLQDYVTEVCLMK